MSRFHVVRRALSWIKWFGQATNLLMVASVTLFSLFLLLTYVHSSVDELHETGINNQAFKVLKDPEGRYSVLSAAAAVTSLRATLKLETRLDEGPFWIELNTSNLIGASDKSIAFETRHLASLSCWGFQSGRLIEGFTVSGFEQSSVSYQSGAWIYRVPKSFDFNTLECRAAFIGPAVLSIQFLDNTIVERRIAAFERDRGFLEGGLAIMIGLVFVAALFNRSRLFLCYGFWLIGSLRLAAMSLGWDQHLFGIQVPLDRLPEIRMLGMSIYFGATLMLASCLFDNFLNRFWYPFLLFLQGMIVVFGVMTFTCSYKTFLLVMWPISVLACSVVAMVVIQHFLMRRNTVSAYYLCAMLITLCGVVAEVLQASLGVDFFVRLFNPGTVTLLASAMTAVSLMEYVRNTQKQREQAAVNMEKMHERLKNVFNIAPAAMFVADSRGKFIEYNRHFENEFLNEHGEALFDFLKAPDLAALYAGKGNTSDLNREEIRIGLGKGQVRWFELIWARDTDDLVGVVSDFTSRKDRELALHHQATHDELTGALNRRGLEWAIQMKLDQGGTELQLYHLDIKRFRHVIRAYGLYFSDRVLKAFYTELYRYMCAFADLCRLHIDQFVVLVNEEHAKDAAEAFERFRTRLKSGPFWIDNRQVMIDMVSCQVHFDGQAEVNDMLDALEETVRESKIIAKSKPHMDHQAFTAVQTLQFLDRARAVGRLGMQELPRQLCMAWQPILSLERPDNHLYAESLLRIRGEDGVMRSAGYLIDACVQAGQTALLDSWVLNTTISYLERNLDGLVHLDAIAINVSPNSLNDEFFLEDTIALINAHKGIARKICLEITEVGAVVNLKAVQDFIYRVRALGVRIALDDFGAGYSNFRYAIDLHADVIKIDGSIIQQISQGTESLAVARAISALSQDLGCKCVAEWVEDEHTLALLGEIEVDYAQGFLIAPALEPDLFLYKSSVVEVLESLPQKSRLLAGNQIER